MSIESIISTRDIKEVVHFTTNPGLTGILYQQAIQARESLQVDQTLEFILKINTKKVFDAAWKGYVNLSISRINKALFGYSEYWHPDEAWRILAFDPAIMCHQGVHFVTTNNAYWQHLRRGTGAEALALLFDDEVEGIRGSSVRRSFGMPDSWTTDVQAEVLYPKSLSTKYLKTIYVPTQVDADSVAGTLAALQHPEVPIRVAKELFSK